MAKTTTKTAGVRRARAKAVQPTEKDGTYVLKLIMYLILGTFWIHVLPTNGGDIPIPFGFLIGLLFATHDHFSIDRKVEYAILLIAGFVGFVNGYGMLLQVGW